MATLNPLEKKARTSFIKGLVIAGLIGVIIIVILAVLIFKMNEKDKARIAAQKSVLIINQDIKSGEEITMDFVSTQLANAEVASTGALSMGDFNQLSTLTDEAGNLLPVKVIAKIDIPAKTIITADMISVENEIVTDDVREQEYNMIVLPSALESGDTIDIRLSLPSGEDYIVISKKKVTLADLGGTFSAQTILMNVNEGEILTMSAAIVDAYQISGSKLYATKYVDPGFQGASTQTYVPSTATVNLINIDPNIVTTARNALISRYNNSYSQYRSGVDNALNGIDETTRQSGIESGRSSEIATQQSERQTYLEQMYGM